MTPAATVDLRHRARRRESARGGRRWQKSVRRFAAEELAGARVGDAWKRRIVYEVSRTPSLMRRAGVTVVPATPASVRAGDIETLKHGLPWSPATYSLHFAALRRLLRWAGSPLAADRGVWAVPSGSTGRRRWLAPEQLGRLYRTALGRERILLALEGFNGLRRVEVLRLRLKDVDFDRGRLRVLGKGRNGGKWRTLPMFPETARLLRGLGTGADEAERVVPLSRSGADLVLRRAAERAGFLDLGVRVSHHDLRRTFGRLAHRAGMDLVQLKNLYGHTSLDQTVHYIGLDEDEMRAGLDRLATLIGPLLRTARGDGGSRSQR
jgi:integrase